MTDEIKKKLDTFIEKANDGKVSMSKLRIVLFKILNDEEFLYVFEKLTFENIP